MQIINKLKKLCIIKNISKIMEAVKSNNLSIKEKSQKQIYKLKAPRLLYMNPSEVFVNKYAPYPNEADLFKWDENKVKTEKIKGESYGYWDFIVQTINSGHFNSRGELDDLFLPNEFRTVSNCCVQLNKIAINEAFERLNVDVSCNMDYYLKHPEEIEKDLNREKKEDEFNSPRLEQELFYAQMCQIFGESETSDELEQAGKNETNFDKVFMLKDFHLLSNDGNSIYATAKRGNFYLLFFFVY